jgi:hypothetical protein
MTERLRRALHEAELDVDDVARAAGVNHRTVQRWMAGRTPRPRYRRHLGRLVGREETYLWPHLALDDPTAVATSAEVHEAYAHRSDLTPEAWWELFRGATACIDLLGYAVLHLPENHPRLPDLLRGKAADGCAIRVALADPECAMVAHRDEEEGLGGTLAARIRTSIHYLEPLAGCDGVELRAHATPMYNSIFRFDDEMLVTPHMFGRPGRLAPLFHLRRRKDGGVFDNFATHFEDVWATAAPMPAAGER